MDHTRLGEDKELSFGHVEYELPFRHSSGEACRQVNM